MTKQSHEITTTSSRDDDLTTATSSIRSYIKNRLIQNRSLTMSEVTITTQ